MDKIDIGYKIEQIAHNGAFDGVNADYIEREANKLVDEIFAMIKKNYTLGYYDGIEEAVKTLNKEINQL